MDLMNLFTNIAKTTHFDSKLEELMASLPKEIQSAFISNDSSIVKSSMPESQRSADRTTVFNW